MYVQREATDGSQISTLLKLTETAKDISVCPRANNICSGGSENPINLNLASKVTLMYR